MKLWAAYNKFRSIITIINTNSITKINTMITIIITNKICLSLRVS